MALRDPDKTKSNILMVAAQTFHMKGYKGTSLSDILTAANVSKGALYHHFSNKQELLYAVFDELYRNEMLARWLPIKTADDPIEAIASQIEEMSCEGTEFDRSTGCPVQNLSAELSTQDEGVRQRVDNLHCEFKSIIEGGLSKAQNDKNMSSQLDAEGVALFIMCSLTGMRQMAKSCQDQVTHQKLTTALTDYVRSLKVS